MHRELTFEQELQALANPDGTWLVRFDSGFILGPYRQETLAGLLSAKSWSAETELGLSDGYWFRLSSPKDMATHFPDIKKVYPQDKDKTNRTAIRGRTVKVVPEISNSEDEYTTFGEIIPIPDEMPPPLERGKLSFWFLGAFLLTILLLLWSW